MSMRTNLEPPFQRVLHGSTLKPMPRLMESTIDFGKNERTFYGDTLCAPMFARLSLDEQHWPKQSGHWSPDTR